MTGVTIGFRSTSGSSFCRSCFTGTCCGRWTRLCCRRCCGARLTSRGRGRSFIGFTARDFWPVTQRHDRHGYGSTSCVSRKRNGYAPSRFGVGGPVCGTVGGRVRQAVTTGGRPAFSRFGVSNGCTGRTTRCVMTFSDNFFLAKSSFFSFC